MNERISKTGNQPAKQAFFAVRTIWTLKLTERWGESENDSKEDVDGSLKKSLENIRKY